MSFPCIHGPSCSRSKARYSIVKRSEPRIFTSPPLHSLFPRPNFFPGIPAEDFSQPLLAVLIIFIPLVQLQIFLHQSLRMLCYPSDLTQAIPFLMKCGNSGELLEVAMESDECLVFRFISVNSFVNLTIRLFSSSFCDFFASPTSSCDKMVNFTVLKLISSVLTPGVYRI